MISSTGGFLIRCQGDRCAMRIGAGNHQDVIALQTVITGDNVAGQVRARDIPTWISELAYARQCNQDVFGIFFSSTPFPLSRWKKTSVRANKNAGFRSRIIRRHEPSRSSSGAELRVFAGQ